MQERLTDAEVAHRVDITKRHLALQEEHRAMGYCPHCAPEIRAWRGFLRLVTGKRAE